jgi:hypothetical protein
MPSLANYEIDPEKECTRWPYATKPPELHRRVVSFGTRFLTDSWLMPG